MAAVEQHSPPQQAAEPAPPAEVDVLIVGTGFSGLGMAIRLEQAGMHDFVVLERADEVGGTWYANTYPGCACDVPSNLYSFSFAPNPEWPETYSRQPEIGAYLRRCADRFGIRPHIRFGHDMTGAEWDDDHRRWDVHTDRGSFRARVLVTGTGPLFEPKIPDLPGLESFRGRVFHSARWDHEFDVKGERVGAIGTGASAIQLVPEVQPEVEKLHVFQRTPPWVMPHVDRPTTRFAGRLVCAFPAAERAARAGVYVGRESFVLGFVKRPRLMRIADRIARRHMHRQVSDPELLEKVMPDYTIGCKRILPSNKWYPALSQPNVDLVTDGIAEVRESSIVTRDGTEREVDAIIFSTGFHVADMPIGGLVRGRDGLLLDETWEGSPRAHVGSTVHGFPNLFLLLGPNTGLGHGSMVYMIESQIAHVMGALGAMDEQGMETVEVREETVARYTERLDAQMAGTVWSSGCASWYQDETGRNPTLWPDWTFRFRRRAARFDPHDYVLMAPEADRAAVAA